MSESAYWEIDVPWADADVVTTVRTEGDQEQAEHQIGPGGVLRATDDGESGAKAYVVSGSVTLFRSDSQAATTVTEGESLDLRSTHWWRNDSDAMAVLRLSRPG